eukprot:11409937-Alexandrium_andersonii.AAC.1
MQGAADAPDEDGGPSRYLENEFGEESFEGPEGGDGAGLVDPDSAAFDGVAWGEPEGTTTATSRAGRAGA